MISCPCPERRVLGRRGLLAAVLAAAWCGCASNGTDAPVPMAHEQPAAAPLPDGVERTAQELISLVLAREPALAGQRVERLREYDRERSERGEPTTGLVDNAQVLVAAAEGEAAFTDFAERMLDTGPIDPSLARRLKRYLENQPLARAARHTSDHRWGRAATIVNRITEPISRLFLGGALNPVESGRAAVSALLVTRNLPAISVQQRQALRDYQDFLKRHPAAPEAGWVSERVEGYQHRLDRVRRDEALDHAERALDKGRPDAAFWHLDRAERNAPLGERGEELRARAVALDREQRARIAATLEAAPDEREGPETEPVLEALPTASLERVKERAEDLASSRMDPALDDELAFSSLLATRQVAEFSRGLRDLVREYPDGNMARHARSLLADPDRDPYRFYRNARSSDRRAKTSWVLLGARRKGARSRNLWRPLEWILDIPSFAVAIATSPLRLYRLPSMGARFGGGVILAGERYLAHYPEGYYADGVHGDLESRYAARGRLQQALEHARLRTPPDEKAIRRYREAIAERMLQAADTHARIDTRGALYRQIVLEYGDTEQAEPALRAFQELVTEYTPQEIRVSRGFLEEHPLLWQPDALGLVPELFDGDEDNGELAEQGVTLLGQTAVRIDLVERDPLVREVPVANFTRFVALLEEVSYRRLISDQRNRPVADARRDLFFERARLGLLDQPDMRPAATSRAVFESTREQHGGLQRRESVLPVELVLQGGLDDFGLAAFPRVKAPRGTADAFLYR